MPARYLQAADTAALAERLAPLFGHDLAEQPPIAMKQFRAMSRYDAGATVSARRYSDAGGCRRRGSHRAGRTGRALAAAIPGAEYVELADAGHGAPIHRADEINTLLAAHWSSKRETAEWIDMTRDPRSSDPRIHVDPRPVNVTGARPRATRPALLNLDAQAAHHAGDDVVHHRRERAAECAEHAVDRSAGR